MEEIIEKLNEAQENQNIPGVRDSDFILTLLEKMLNKQEEDVVNYMNDFMTQPERNRHGDHIWGFLLRSQATLAKIRLEMMADGRKIN